MKQRHITLLLIALAMTPVILADEGMWLPMLLNRNEAAMQKAGMHISAKDIYDVNHASLKDAVVLFGGGCTGEFVSAEGLLLTNHHCGYGQIVRHSTVEHDYLTNGFWAMSREQEIPCPGLNVVRLVRMEDVTAQVLKGIDATISESKRASIIKSHIDSICNAAVQGTHYNASIKPLYYGNQYFMYVNEVFTDVRMVGAPPSNIGKFGGDTDNWMWPRHTGDFSVFRVYASPEGKPADYSADNVPYRPLKHLKISLKGVEEGDFTFVFGYPGTTQRYQTHDYVNYKSNYKNPAAIALRDIRLSHYNRAMQQSPAQRLRYASIAAGIANAWKKWQGESQGLERLHAVELKQKQENRFIEWAKQYGTTDGIDYANVLSEIYDINKTANDIDYRLTYLAEGILASEMMSRAITLRRIVERYSADDEQAQAEANKLIASNKKFFEDFENHSAVDCAIFVKTAIYAYRQGQAPYLGNYGDDEESIAESLRKIYKNTMLTQRGKMEKILKSIDKRSRKKIADDPAYRLLKKAYDYAYSTNDQILLDHCDHKLDSLHRLYVHGLMLQYPDSNFFPDANLTLRVAYGHVAGFRPRDAIRYDHYSTLQGIIEKEDPNIYDYVVEPRLKELYANRDYGRYANSKGELPVGFITTSHTTGGNSGSPMLNADGDLIGLNFDRCWEGTMSDLLFDPNYCRNICLDIRYCLFIIDKFAGAKHLIDEMEISD